VYSLLYCSRKRIGSWSLRVTRLVGLWENLEEQEYLVLLKNRFSQISFILAYAHLQRYKRVSYVTNVYHMIFLKLQADL